MKNINFWSRFSSSFSIFTSILHINLIYKIWVDLINKRQQENHSLLGTKNESHGINLSQRQWVLQLFESDKGSLYNQANCIEEYEYDKGLYYNNYEGDFDDKSGESDSDFDSESDSDSDCKSDRNSKNNVKSERNVIVSINTLQFRITSATRLRLYVLQLVIDRRSYQRRSIKRDVFKDFAKFTGKHLCWSLLFDKIADSA